MARRKNRLDPQHRALSSEKLMQIFNSLDCPANRIKKGKGYIKLAVAKFGDAILDELKARRIAAGADY